MDMLNCSSCEGFVPVSAGRCPHCDARIERRSPFRKLLNIAGGGAVAMTLMACYGGGPHDYAPPQTPETAGSCSNVSEDLDHDGYCSDDCDETNADIHPGAADAMGDGIDQNCDGADGMKSDTIAE